MRLVATSIVILSGVLAASAGTVAESFMSSRQSNDLDSFGIFLAAVGLVVFMVEWWRTRSSSPNE